jgi:hypothetical protein
MAHRPKSSQRTADCQIKRVNPAVRSVSAVDEGLTRSRSG